MGEDGESREGGEVTEEQKGRKSFEDGIFLEREFAFTQVVGKFYQEAVREGSFKGKGNLGRQEEGGEDSTDGREPNGQGQE
jgi:hypothetical protein